MGAFACQSAPFVLARFGCHEMCLGMTVMRLSGHDCHVSGHDCHEMCLSGGDCREMHLSGDDCHEIVWA